MKTYMTYFSDWYSCTKILEEVPSAEEGEDFLESLFVDPDDLSITLTSSSGEVKKVYFDDQNELHTIGTAVRYELYKRDYENQTIKEPVLK